MASAGLACIKCITIFCNLLFMLTGISVFLVGVTVQSNYSHYSNFVSDQFWTVPIISIIVGASVTIICFLGCCGALTENSFMICMFAVLALILFAIEVGLGIAGYVKHVGLHDIMEAQFNDTIQHYHERDDYRDAWSLLQTELGCCGAYGSTDWENIFQNSTLPVSCCAVINLNEATECTTVHANPDGCLKILFSIMDSKTLILGSVGLGVAAIQIFIIILACCLFRLFG